MAIEVKHATQAAGTDAGDGEIAKAQWNEAHAINMATDKVLGRSTAGAGAVEEISIGGGLTLTGGELAAEVTASSANTLTNKTLADPVITGAITEDVFTITDGASVDINPANGTIQLWTLGASRTPTASSFLAGESVTLMINDGTAYTVTWTTAAVVWVGGIAPTLALTGYTVIELWKVGTTLYGSRVGQVA